MHQEQAPPGPGGAAAGRQGWLRAERVVKSFGPTRVLRGMSLEVDAGQVVCIIGPSGSGKSTFLRCINALERIDAGRIYVGGKLVGYQERRGRLYELRDSEAARRRLEIGMVFQQFNLFPHRTVLGNLTESPVHVLREDKASAMRRCRDLLARVGLADKENAYPSELSGGQQQRVAIARALALRPQLLLFDEPTSALDPELVGEVLDVMRQLAHDGITMLVVTHEIGFAREVADKIVFMDAGRTVEEGPPSEVLVQPRADRTKKFLASIM